MKRLIKSVIFLMVANGFAQQTFSLQECYRLIENNYPLVQQYYLLEKQNALDLKVIETDRLPSMAFAAQATYQSDVVEVPIPNAEIAPLNKDQYRATLSINQLIYDGGTLDIASQIKSAVLETKKKQVEVHLYQLKKQINQLYFSVLLAQENKHLLMAITSQLEAKLKEVASGVKYGTVLPTSDKIIEAELLRIKQKTIEVEQNKLSLLQTLTSILGENIPHDTPFVKENIMVFEQNEKNRPEFDLFQLKKNQIEVSEALLAKKHLPKVFGFATGGYGNPGLNMLDNSFQTFYTVGVKMNWNVFDWHASKKEQQSLAINKEIIDTEIDVFEINKNIELQQYQSEINKIKAFITSDFEIVSLRKQVLLAADSQLKNGVITASAYLIELTNLYEDENTLAKHEIQLQLAKANYNITKGN
ncbi:TolC family protein [Mariniflexile ostreae]|uniref:TolC family protein n=1 Tax=Mariniflexile ostreae TaxID=1520892 RepID=A0ABV5F9H2_9FLAO